jgi:3-dehydroquinate synthase
MDTQTFRKQIDITPNLKESLCYFLKTSRYSGAVLVSSDNIFQRYGQDVLESCQDAGLSIFPFMMENGEKSKTLATAEACWQQMHTKGLDRSSLVIALGGGVVTDVAGFIAACYMRGIDVIHLPTTLLAMVDAAIGGKTGVNLPSGKNLIGAFHHPKLVLAACNTLKTLPARELRSGIAEVIKYGVIKDPALFAFLEKNMDALLSLDPHAIAHVISCSCSIKTEIVQEDEKERGTRAFLNYGHTFAHALETATHYHSYLHGEAVSIGMCCAAITSRLMGLTDDALVRRLKDLCLKAGLPVKLPSDIDINRFITLMEGDKKASFGKIHLILPETLGSVRRIANVDRAIIRQALIESQGLKP